MTRGNGTFQKRLLTAAACLAMAVAMAAMPGGAYAGDDSGGKGHDGHEKNHEKKHSDQGHGVYDAKDLLDRYGVEKRYGDFHGSGGSGSGSGGGKVGSCSRC